MKLLTCLGIILWASLVSAAHLTCDPDPNCQWYNVYADDVLIQPDIAAPLNYDLVDMTPGIINFDAECCNYWGCKKTVNPYVSLDAPGEPLNLRMDTQP